MSVDMVPYLMGILFCILVILLVVSIQIIFLVVHKQIILQICEAKEEDMCQTEKERITDGLDSVKRKFVRSVAVMQKGQCLMAS